MLVRAAATLPHHGASLTRRSAVEVRQKKSQDDAALAESQAELESLAQELASTEGELTALKAEDESIAVEEADSAALFDSAKRELERAREELHAATKQLREKKNALNESQTTSSETLRELSEELAALVSKHDILAQSATLLTPMHLQDADTSQAESEAAQKLAASEELLKTLSVEEHNEKELTDEVSRLSAELAADGDKHEADAAHRAKVNQQLVDAERLRDERAGILGKLQGELSTLERDIESHVSECVRGAAVSTAELLNVHRCPSDCRIPISKLRWLSVQPN